MQRYDHLTPAQQLEELHTRPHPDNLLDLRHMSTLETAEKSLISGLPNEIDLSLNSILFLSAVVHPSPATPMRLSNSRNILQLMLATIGVFEDGTFLIGSLLCVHPCLKAYLPNFCCCRTVFSSKFARFLVRLVDFGFRKGKTASSPSKCISCSFYFIGQCWSSICL